MTTQNCTNYLQYLLQTDEGGLIFVFCLSKYVKNKVTFWKLKLYILYSWFLSLMLARKPLYQRGNVKALSYYFI